MILENEFTPLSEASVSNNGSMKIRIIAPGMGASGYYSESLLSKSAGLYKRGTHMHLNHPSRSELKERPERSLNDLAGYLTTDGRYETNGAYGPGIYAECKIFDRFLNFVKEAAPVIGISHMCQGRTSRGTIDGNPCTIVESIDSVQSVDIVTQPGARGAFITESHHQPFNSGQSAMSEYHKSLVESGLKPETADMILENITGQTIAPAVPVVPGQAQMSEGHQAYIKSLVDSGLSETTATQIVMRF